MKKSVKSPATSVAISSVAIPSHAPDTEVLQPNHISVRQKEIVENMKKVILSYGETEWKAIYEFHLQITLFHDEFCMYASKYESLDRYSDLHYILYAFKDASEPVNPKGKELSFYSVSEIADYIVSQIFDMVPGKPMHGFSEEIRVAAEIESTFDEITQLIAKEKEYDFGTFVERISLLNKILEAFSY